jgi:pyoverdine/dityrosine biosynthesis protein Dit1
MPKWSVLMTTSDYVEVEADSPREAEMEALRMYKRLEIHPEHPIFFCEDIDLIEE